MISPIFTVNAAGFFVRRMGAKHGNAPAISIRAHSISAKFGSIPRTISGFIYSASHFSFRMMAEKLSADLSDKLHPDMHALAIQNGSAPPPKPPKPEDKNKPPKPPVSLRLIVGNDGGVYQSYAGGKGWEHLNRIPAGEFYRISLDDSRPIYRIAGG